jgi:hypothetical protein
MSSLDQRVKRDNRAFDQLIEDGKLYGTSPHLTVAAGTNQYVTFTTPASRQVHLYLSFVATGSTRINVYTGSIISVPGTLRNNAPFNLTAPNTSQVVVREGVSVSDVGTMIADFLIPGGQGGNAVGGAVGQAQKVILPANTVFLFEADNLGTNDIFCEPTFAWFEVDV